MAPMRGASLSREVPRVAGDLATALGRVTDMDKVHGGVSTRTPALASDIVWLQENRHWPGLNAFGRISSSPHSSPHFGIRERSAEGSCL